MKRWEHRFELKPGRWVFVPTAEVKASGEKIHSSVSKAWSAPSFYFHLQQGGHVAALRRHLDSQHFFRCDLDDFFGRVNRSRVTRCLKRYFSYADARRVADESVVFRPGTSQTVLPYGYVQSPMLASLALDRSRLGRFLRQCNSREDMKVSVYMDDIILSSDDRSLLNDAAAELAQHATGAGFPLSPEKSQGPSALITAFNIELSHGVLSISRERLDRFRESYSTAKSPQEEMGIIGYVESINPAQVGEL